jgi:TRAP-type C4-dicarboxylate transport system permease small subunit
LALKVVAIGSAVAIFVVMVVGVVDIVLGETLGFYLPFKVDMSGTLTAAAVFLTWPLVQWHRTHISVDLFDPFMPAWLVRIRWWVAQFAGLVFVMLLTYGIWVLALDSMAIWEQSAATLGYPIWPAKLACAIGATLTCLILVVQIVARATGHDQKAEAIL